MAEIPTNEVTADDLATWFTAKRELAALKAKEILLRMKIYKGKFFKVDEHLNPIESPKEGTNTVILDDGYQLKAVRVVDRGVDAGTLDALKKERNELKELAEKGEQLNDDERTRLAILIQIAFDTLIEYKPALKVKEYRTLTEEQRNLFDECLVIKDGSPQLDIVKPSAKSTAAAKQASAKG